MYPNVCPVCKSKLYKMDSQSPERDMVNRRNFKREKRFITKRKEQPFRTSTPVPELEKNKTTDLSDSVNEFFYQSWKKGLHSEYYAKSQNYMRKRFTQPYYEQQPTQVVYYPIQIVYVNTVIYQPVSPTLGTFPQQIVYGPDGNFGLTPVYWPYSNS